MDETPMLNYSGGDNFLGLCLSAGHDGPGRLLLTMLTCLHLHP